MPWPEQDRARALASFNVAPCSENPQLHDSIELYDHYEARVICLGCSSRVQCRAIALTDRKAQGTFGGDLFVKGSVAMAIDS